MKFPHLEYGRDHGPDHTREKINIRLCEFLPPEADFFFALRNSSYCNSFTFGNLRIHPHSEGDPGGDSLEKNGGVTPTVRGTFLERKTEGSPPL